MSMAELFSNEVASFDMYIHSYRRNRKIANYEMTMTSIESEEATEISTDSLKASKMCAYFETGAFSYRPSNPD